jgi:hypothetical protein
MDSRREIYALNAVLKRRADAQFEKLAAEKAAMAVAKAQLLDGGDGGVEGQSTHTTAQQEDEDEDEDGHGDGMSGSDYCAAEVIRPVRGLDAVASDGGGAVHRNRPGAPYPDDDDDDDDDDDNDNDGGGRGGDAAVPGQADADADADADAQACSETRDRIASQLSLLQGMSAAGVLTDEQCEAAAATLLVMVVPAAATATEEQTAAGAGTDAGTDKEIPAVEVEAEAEAEADAEPDADAHSASKDNVGEGTISSSTPS